MNRIAVVTGPGKSTHRWCKGNNQVFTISNSVFGTLLDLSYSKSMCPCLSSIACYDHQNYVNALKGIIASDFSLINFHYQIPRWHQRLPTVIQLPGVVEGLASQHRIHVSTISRVRGKILGYYHNIKNMNNILLFSLSFTLLRKRKTSSVLVEDRSRSREIIFHDALNNHPKNIKILHWYDCFICFVSILAEFSTDISLWILV